MDNQIANNPTCPFCPFSDADTHFVTSHVQLCHPEDGLQTGHETSISSTVLPSGSEANQKSNLKGVENQHSRTYIALPHRNIDMTDSPGLKSQHNLHIAQQITSVSKQEHPYKLESSNLYAGDTVIQGDPLEMQSSSIQSSRGLFKQSERIPGPYFRGVSNTAPKEGIKRLGRSELGPYAYEKRMPMWLRKILEKGATTTKLNTIANDGRISTQKIIENETPGVIPAIARICEEDSSVQRAFLCSAHVHQISKMPGEGGFCGYRNIQMLITYIQESRSPGYTSFPNLPTILQLQDMIEHAWDMGFNSAGRQETGGIKGTRKYIGTSEAQALFQSLGIQCEATSIENTNEMLAHNTLLAHIAAYFRSACTLDTGDKVVMTNLPPIYLQRPGHSLTIVGFEIRDNRSANILVFDPTSKAPSGIKHPTSKKSKSFESARLLKTYRRGVDHLRKYKTFELLKLVPRVSLGD